MGYLKFVFNERENRLYDSELIVCCHTLDNRIVRPGKEQKPFVPIDVQRLATINGKVNNSILQVRDQSKDMWRVAIDKGDCEDIALRKKRDLVRAGMTRLQLPLVAVLTPKGEPHIVLGVLDENGQRAWILDNMTDQMMRWERIPHKITRMESPIVGGKWLDYESIRWGN